MASDDGKGEKIDGYCSHCGKWGHPARTCWSREAEAKGVEREGRIQQLQQAFTLAKAEASAAETKAQTAVEEASVIKRESAAAVVTLRESLARVEAEKAAALKEAAEAATALAKLQAQFQASPKPANP